RFNMEIYGSAIILIIAAFIFALGQRGTDAFANQYFTYGRGIQNFLEASLLFATLKAAGLFSAPLCGRLSDIYNRKKVLIALVIIESVSLYAITVTPTTLLAAPCLVFGFASFGLLAVSDALLADITPEEYRSTLFGANVTVSFTSTIFLSPILGSIADLYSFDVGFILLSALMPLSILFILKVKTKPAQQNKNT
ncbi:MAG TPA: MFS transporter, partial [Candidatus Bathyarchaeia archaeon]|nr:MFS transporter [Candidatus Bathyarchaeia archaeon]